MTHNLKIHPQWFHALSDGKNFEVRKNDRSFQKGDHLLLSEYDPESKTYTRKICHALITYVYSDFDAISGYGPARRSEMWGALRPEFVILGIEIKSFSEGEIK